MKCKQFIAGIIVGAMLSIMPISAAIEEFICYRADYKLMIQGQEFVSEELPLLNYKGYTYGPLRPMLEAAGLEVNWNAELGQAEAELKLNPTDMGLEVEDNIMKRSEIEYDLVTGLPIGAEYVNNTIEIEKSGIKKTVDYKTIAFNGKTYISEFDLRSIYNIVFSGKGTFVDKDTNDVVTIDFQTDTFTVKATLYVDMSLFEGLIGE